MQVEHSWRPLLPSPVLEGLGLLFSSHEATSGFAARYGPQFRSRGFAADGILAPLLPGASRRHAGGLATCLFDFSTG